MMTNDCDGAAAVGENDDAAPSETGARSCAPVCFACGGPLFDLRGKLQCRQCGRICESCCEGRVQ